MLKATLVIILTLLFSLPTISFSKELNNKIKFHPPETEAEKALDVILRVESRLIEGNAVSIYALIHNNKSIDAFTQDLNSAFKKWRDEIYASGTCETDDLCFGESSKFTCAQDDLTDIGFLYYSIKKDDIIYVYLKSKGFKYQYSQLNDVINKLEFEKNDSRIRELHNYAMKKEDGEWKIDGVCCKSSRFNHKYCGFDGYKTFLHL